MIRLAVALTLLALVAPRAQAQAPGDLDVTFAGFQDGIVDNGAAVRAMAIQPDGRIVVAGSSGGGVEIRRFLENGEADPTFGTGGVAVLAYPAGVLVHAYGIAVGGPHGDIFIGGVIQNNPGSFIIGSLDSHGNINTLWNNDGWVVTDYGFTEDGAYDIIVQPDGKVVAAGYAIIGSDSDFAAIRYESWGVLDNTFGGDGKVAVGFGANEYCRSLALQSDGKLVLVGENEGTFDTDFAICRLNINGSLDGSFSGDGKLTVGFGDLDIATGVAIQPDGKIIVSGSELSTDNGRVIRLLTNGSLDATFEGDGIAYDDNSSYQSVAVMGNGKIVLGGYHTSPDGDWKVVFNRLNPNGAMDMTMGAGAVYADLGTATDRCWEVAVGLDGRIIGNCQGAGSSGGLVRMWPDGTFDTGGRQTVGFPDDFTEAGLDLMDATSFAMAVQVDGKIVLAGDVTNADVTEKDFAVTRLNVDGTVDARFGVNGRAQLGFFQYDLAKAVAIQPDGKIVVAGHMVNGSVTNFMVARFLTTGVEDGSFGFGGLNVIDFMGGDDFGSAMALAPDGKIVVAGTVWNGARFVFGVARFNTDGTPDNTFDTDAKQLCEFTVGLPHEAQAVLVQPDRKIIVGGTVNDDFALVRFNENGSVDGTFGTSGKLVADMGGADRLRALALANDNWIYAAGSRDVGGNKDFALAQISPEGILCEGARCGRWGKIYKDFGGADIAYAVDVRNDGRVVMAGVGNLQFAWAQFRTAAPIDTPLVGLTDFHGVGESVRAVQFAGPDWILTAGVQSYNGHPNFAVARFITTPMTIGSVSGVADGDPGDAASSIRLHGAYPNPLVSRSMIAFDVAGDETVRLRLYDVTGRLVRTLAEERFVAGRHEIAWDGMDDSGRQVSAGMYFVRMEAGGRVEKNSIVVAR